MGTVAGTGTLDGHRHVYGSAGLDECTNIVLPGRLVEIDRKKPASFVFEQRIDTYDMTSAKVVEDNLIVDREECLIWAFTAFDLRKITDSPYELVRTGGRVAGFFGLLANEPRGENILAAFEQGSKEPDLFYRRPRRLGVFDDRQDRSGRLTGGQTCEFLAQELHPGTGGLALSVKLSESGFFVGQFPEKLLFEGWHRNYVPQAQAHRPETAPEPAWHALEVDGTAFWEDLESFCRNGLDKRG